MEVSPIDVAVKRARIDESTGPLTLKELSRISADQEFVDEAVGRYSGTLNEDGVSTLDALKQQVATMGPVVPKANQNMSERLAQQAASQLDGSLTGLGGYIKRNGLSIQHAGDSMASRVRMRYDINSNPVGAMNNFMAIGNNAMAGAEQARIDHERKKAEREAAQAKARRDQALKRFIGKASISEANDGPPPTPRPSFIAGSGVGGANVKPAIVNMVSDTRSYGQRFADEWIANPVKQIAGSFVDQGLNYLQNKGSQKLGYLGMSAKLKLDDLMEKRREKEQAKAEEKYLREAERKLRTRR